MKATLEPAQLRRYRHWQRLGVVVGCLALASLGHRAHLLGAPALLLHTLHFSVLAGVLLLECLRSKDRAYSIQGFGFRVYRKPETLHLK